LPRCTARSSGSFWSLPRNPTRLGRTLPACPAEEIPENSIVRARVLISAALAAAKLLETGELEDRIESLEAAVGVGRPTEPEADQSWP
jgi:hypothetical protein